MVASQKYAITGWLMALQPLFDVYKYSVFVELLLLFSISIPEVLLGASFLKYKMLIDAYSYNNISISRFVSNCIYVTDIFFCLILCR